MPQILENRPTAEILMVSMRAMGYSFEAAIADVVDNSISAGASQVHIGFPYAPTDSYVTICDNGTGMTHDELFDAMKYGSEKKSSHDADSPTGGWPALPQKALACQARLLLSA